MSPSHICLWRLPASCCLQSGPLIPLLQTWPGFVAIFPSPSIMCIRGARSSVPSSITYLLTSLQSLHSLIPPPQNSILCPESIVSIAWGVAVLQSERTAFNCSGVLPVYHMYTSVALYYYEHVFTSYYSNYAKGWTRVQN